MVDIIVALVVAIFLIGGGIGIGYDICKRRAHKVPKENRLIGKEDFHAIRAALMFVAAHGDEEVRAIKRKAFIALYKASEIYSDISLEKIEEAAGFSFDAWLEAVDSEYDDEKDEEE